ncbi:hypothetical protein ACFQXA_25635 [Nocardiopsis composta]
MTVIRLPEHLEPLLTDEPVLDVYEHGPWRVPDGLVEEISELLTVVIEDDRGLVFPPGAPAGDAAARRRRLVYEVLDHLVVISGALRVNAGSHSCLPSLLVEKHLSNASPSTDPVRWIFDDLRMPPGYGLIEVSRTAEDREIVFTVLGEILEAAAGIVPWEGRRKAMQELLRERAADPEAHAFDLTASPTSSAGPGAAGWTGGTSPRSPSSPSRPGCSAGPSRSSWPRTSGSARSRTTSRRSRTSWSPWRTAWSCRASPRWPPRCWARAATAGPPSGTPPPPTPSTWANGSSRRASGCGRAWSPARPTPAGPGWTWAPGAPSRSPPATTTCCASPRAAPRCRSTASRWTCAGTAPRRAGRWRWTASPAAARRTAARPTRTRSGPAAAARPRRSRRWTSWTPWSGWPR